MLRYVKKWAASTINVNAIASVLISLAGDVFVVGVVVVVGDGVAGADVPNNEPRELSFGADYIM